VSSHYKNQIKRVSLVQCGHHRPIENKLVLAMVYLKIAESALNNNHSLTHRLV